MKIAFIGASHWHLPLYLQPALEVPGVSVVGFSDPDPSVTARLSRQFGCAGHTDFRELCTRVKPDFVFALGRHVDMPDQARFLIAQGIPFALEKPCGLDEGEVRALAEQAAAAAAFAAVPLVFRNGEFLKTLEELRGDGGLQYATYRFIAGFPSRYTEAGCEWMYDPRLSGGGCTINLAVHFFDLCLLLMGPDVAVTQAIMSNAAWGHPTEDYSAVTLMRGKDVCTVETGYLFPAQTSNFDMHFAVRTPARYLIAPNQEIVEITDNSGQSEVRPMATTNVANYRPFVFDVLARARDGRPPLASLADMVPVMRLVDSAYAMAKPLQVRR